MTSFTSHLLVSVLMLFLAERVFQLAKVSGDTKKRWEMVLLLFIALYLFLGFFFTLP